MIRIDDVEVFLHAAQTGSFSAAARLMTISPALASSAIQRLEQALGVRLFIRSTRSMRLSDAGLRYLPHAQTILAEVARGHAVLAEDHAEISGTLRLSTPSDVGRNVLLPWFDAFQLEHPKLKLHVHVSDQSADLFREWFDVTIRYGHLADSSLVALPLMPDNRLTVCAAPSYVQRFGIPQTPEALLQHNCLCYMMGKHTFDRWNFYLPDGVHTVDVCGDRVSNDAEIVRRWAVAGLGITYQSQLDVWPDVQAGRLVELLPRNCGESTPLQIVCAHRASITPAIQLLRDFLQSRLREMIETDYAIT